MKNKDLYMWLAVILTWVFVAVGYSDVGISLALSYLILLHGKVI